MKRTIPAKITVRFLRKMGACNSHVEAFKKVFPRGAAVTLENIRKAHDADLKVGWLVGMVSNANFHGMCAVCYPGRDTAERAFRILRRRLEPGQ